MKVIMKPALLLMLIAMFMWGCGDNQEDEPICEGQPGCSGGYQEIDQCPQDACCEEVTACGQTILCWTDDPEICPGETTCGETPVCPEGYEQTDQCPQDTCCEEIIACGKSIHCWTSDAILCPVPECPEGLTPVEEAQCGAKEGLLECEIVYGGMDPLYCADLNSNCPAPANIMCPDGLEIVVQCPQDQSEGYCESVTICSETIQCWTDDPLYCAAMLACPEGMEPVQGDRCGTSENGAVLECEPITHCGETYYCTDIVDQCAAVPTCLDGYEQVDECPQDSECEEVTVCGSTIQCMKSM